MIVLNADVQWMEPYTEQQVLNCLKSVRRRVLDVCPSLNHDGDPTSRFPCL